MRLELQPFKLVTDVAVPPSSTLDITPANRQKVELFPIPFSRDYNKNHSILNSSKSESVKLEEEAPKFGMTSVRGRRRDMEDAVSIQSSFTTKNTSFFGVFDGHGCSHVAMKCRDRLHEIVNEEVEGFKEEKPVEWEETMKRSFIKMDKEVESCCVEGDNSSNCRCELKTPQCDAAGSTAVVAVVTPEKIIVSNCGDSRAVFCRNGVAIPLSSDHKVRLTISFFYLSGGRVIYWDGARVLGVLAMSRAIGDNYLKPFVIPEPDVTVTERTGEDECLILASDGLWDVVSNDTACGVVRMCLRARTPPSPTGSPGSDAAAARAATESSDKACSDASILLTKLALARNSSDNVSVVVVDLSRNHQ
ncbi:Protein phosphatase 2C family protein [Salix suchowensis]|nr:Protein phosphatase 2C family protein [Salix suchowensis]